MRYLLADGLPSVNSKKVQKGLQPFPVTQRSTERCIGRYFSYFTKRKGDSIRVNENRWVAMNMMLEIYKTSFYAYYFLTIFIQLLSICAHPTTSETRQTGSDLQPTVYTDLRVYGYMIASAILDMTMPALT